MPSPPEFLLDENVRVEVIDFLRRKGFKAEYVPKGSTNDKVASLAKRKRLVLITHDTGFADPNLYPPKEFSGIIVIRISPSALDEILSSLERALEQVREISGKLVVLEKGRVRIT